VQELFVTLTRAVEGTAAVALGAAFVWGVLSILLSPCHLASIPLIVGFIDKQERTSPRHAFWLSTLFASGILITIALIGVITASLGRMMGDIGVWGNYVVAAVLLLVGLHLLGVIPLSFQGATPQAVQRKGLLAALVLGLVFGIALGPCTFAYMAPMLGIVFTVSATQFLFAVLLLLFYGIGHCSVIVFAGTFTEVIQRYLNWNKDSRGMTMVKKICGVLVILGGIYLIWTV